MAWTTPRTWNAGETVTSSIMNTHIRDNLNYIKTIPRAIVISIGSVGSGVISTGVKSYVEIPLGCEIEGWTLVADVSGSIVIDVWKDTYANFPPVVGDSIAGTEKPTLSSAQKNQDLALTTWTKTIVAGDVLAFNVDSATTVEQVTLTLRLTVT